MMQHFTHKSSAIFQDPARNLWLLGEINQNQLDLKTSKLYEPHRLRFKFISETESISRYHQMPHCLVILTDEARLYVSNYKCSGSKKVTRYLDKDKRYPFDSRLYKYSKDGTSNLQEQGQGQIEFALLSDQVDNLVFSSYLILFTRKINEEDPVKFYLFDPVRASVPNFRINPIIGNFVYFEVYLPFSVESYQLISSGDGSGAFYIRSGDWNHLIAPYRSISYYYFRDNGKEIDPNKIYIWSPRYHLPPKKDQLGIPNRNKQIYYLDGFMKVYLKRENHFSDRLYGEESGQLIHLIGQWNNKHSFVSVGPKVLLHKGIETINLDIDPHVDILSSPDIYFNRNFCVYEAENKPLYEPVGNIIAFNVFGLNRKLVKVTSNAIIYYMDNTLFMISSKTPRNNNLDLIKKIGTTKSTYYLYTFKRMPITIDRLDFSGKLLFVTSNNSIYYLTPFNCCTNCDAYKKLDLGLLKFEAIEHETILNLVDESLIERGENDYESVTISVRANVNYLDRLFQMVEMMDYHVFDIECFDADMFHITATGNGTRRNFFQIAMKDFKERYLIEMNYLTKFNFPKILQLSELELKLMGKILVSYFRNINSSLIFRLPLVFIQGLLKRDLKTEEMEYFLYREDPEKFRNLMKIKTAPNFSELSGHKSYESFLVSSLELNSLAEKEKRAIKLLIESFKFNIKNFNKMNGPTLDYFLSGPYLIDRAKLIQMIKFQKAENESESAFQDNFIIALKEATDTEINNFLINVTGIAIYSNINVKYSSSIQGNIKFSTCFNKILIRRDSAVMYDLEHLRNLLFIIEGEMRDY